MVDEITEHTLILKAQEGDQAALNELISESRRRVLAMIRARLGPTLRPKLDAEDLFQETCVRALESIESFESRGPESFRRWLQGIAENVVHEASRRVGRDLVLDLSAGGRIASESPSRHARRDERFERLQEAVHALPEDYRQVILLARIEGVKIEEIASRMNRSVSSVRNLLLRGMRELRKSFGDTESLHLPDRQLREKGDGSAE